MIRNFILYLIAIATILFFACRKELNEPTEIVNGNNIGSTKDTIYFVVDGTEVSLRDPIIIKPTYAVLQGDFRSVSNLNPVSDFGHCWTSSNIPPNIENTSFTKLGIRKSAGVFEDTLSNLVPNTQYYYTIYVKSGNNIAYHEVRQFKTPSPEDALIQTLQDSNSIKEITQTSAVLFGKVKNAGTYPVVAYGHCWSTNPSPKIDNTKDSTRFIGGLINNQIVTSNIKGLNLNTTYHIRAYCINEKGQVFYGEDAMFTTNDKVITCPELIMQPATNVNISTADFNAQIISTGGSNINESGFLWSITPDFSSYRKKELGSQSGAVFFKFIASDSLQPATKYYVKAYAKNTKCYGWSDYIEITTLTPNTSPPSVITNPITNVTISSAKSSGTITDIGGSSIIQYGFVYSDKNSNPSIQNSPKIVKVGTLNIGDSFTSDIGSLTSGTEYYVRAYATNNYATGYGSVERFSTPTPNTSAPSLMNDNTSNLTTTSANVTSHCTDKGGGDIIEYGHVWSSTSTTPTVAFNEGIKKTSGSPNPFNAPFTSTLDQLTPNTPYWVRAYAKNNVNNSYSYGSPILTFTTESPNVTAPNVTTKAVIALTTTAIAKGQVTNPGGSAVTEYGHVWSKTSQTPTVSNSLGKTVNNGNPGTNEFSSNISGLTANTTYWVRAYAKNSVNTQYSYGDPSVEILTYCEPSISIGQSAANVTKTSADISGNIACLGETKQATQYGHCWSTNQNPTTSDSKTTLGNTTTVGGYNSTLTSLTPNTTYYVRSYMIVGGNTYYSSGVGSVLAFKTDPNIDRPIVSLNNNCNPYSNQISLSGAVTNIGGSTITQHGFCYSLVNNQPTTNDQVILLGALSLPSNINFTINCLDPNKMYYIRAFATNTFGTSYSTSTLTCTTPSSGLVSPCGLVAYYTFDGQNPNDYFATYNGNINGNVTFSTDRPNSNGYSANFDGLTGTFINIPTIFKIDDFTINMWIKSTRTTMNFLSTVLNNFSSNKRFGIEGSRLYAWCTSDFVSNELVDGNWRMVTMSVSWNGSTSTENLYIDGQIKSTRSCPSSNKFFTGEYPLRLGWSYYTNSNGSPFFGKMDNVRIYNKAITQSEVQAIFNAKQ